MNINSVQSQAAFLGLKPHREKCCSVRCVAGDLGANHPMASDYPSCSSQWRKGGAECRDGVLHLQVVGWCRAIAASGIHGNSISWQLAELSETRAAWWSVLVRVSIPAQTS